MNLPGWTGNTPGESPGGTPAFATTHWSVVLMARGGEETGATEALEKLCRAYWYPLYAHVRRRGHDPHEAQDLTQAFFERLLNRGFLRAVDRNKGRFRTFLLTALDHFLANERRRAWARKRGGGKTHFSLDDESVEDRYRQEPQHEETAERLFERQWALTVLENSMRRLEAECAAAGKAALFAALQPLLGGDRADRPHSVLAAQLGLTENALNLALLRLRRRYGELVREEIAQTVARPEEVDEELRHLMECIRG
jgi:RNA polymerase sigma-70 factor (ECF subfamily)